MSNSFTFRAPQDLSALIREVSASRSKPVSVLIREAIRCGLPAGSSDPILLARANAGGRAVELKQ
jgi:hypothetical protein